MDCSGCLWALPETCRACRAEQEEHRLKEAKYQELMTKQLSLVDKVKEAIIQVIWFIFHLLPF